MEKEIETGLENPAGIDSPESPPSMAKKTKEPKSAKKKMPKIVKRILLVLAVVAILYIIPTIKLLTDVSHAKTAGAAFKQAVESQNLDEVKKQSAVVRKSIGTIKGDLVFYMPLRIVPFLGSYVSDANHMLTAADHGLNASDIAVDGLMPYADLLGLKGQHIGQAGTAQERLQLLVATVEKLTPRFDDISKEIVVVRDELNHVNSNRYPSFLFGRSISSSINTTLKTIDQVGSMIVDARPLIEVLPTILGGHEPKTYLVLFQNDKELRPSGGFLTAYTYLTIDQGKISAADSNDMYHLDEAIQRVCRRRVCLELKPPRLIVQYLPEPTGKAKTAWDSRDSNIHPDFVASAMEFRKLYSISGAKKVDGIIAVDTRVIQEILEVTGPIKVAGYQSEFNKDNVINLLMAYTDTVFAGKNDRKALLGDLMGSVLKFISDAGRDKMQPLLLTSLNLMNEKHVMLSLDDEKAQAAIEKFNWAGRIKEYDGDYLAINEANFASGKANFYVKENVERKVEFDKSGNAIATVKVSIEDPQGYNDVLNRGYRAAMRFYVPKGSELVDSSGSQNKVTTYEEFGKTVFEAFNYTQAKNKSEIVITYKLPASVAKKGSEYKLLIQKQPGIAGSLGLDEPNGWHYKLDNFGSKQDVVLDQDREIKTKI